MRILLLFLICWAATTWVPESSAAPTEGTMEEFRPIMTTIAKGVAKVLQSRKEDAITVGAFSGPPNLGSAAGSGIKRMIVEELQRQNIRVARLGTSLGLSGEYRLTKPNENAATRQVQVEVKLTDDSGAVVTDLGTSLDIAEWQQQSIHNDKGKVKIDTWSSPEATAIAAGLTVDFDDVLRRQRNDFSNPIDVIQEASERPTALIVNGNELRASRTSPYGFQVLVNGAPRALRIEDGRPFVKLQLGETFRIGVTNRSANTMSAIVTLDGINSFTFSELRKQDGTPKFAQWILAPRQDLNLAGWHVNNTKAREFKVSDFSESAAALISSDAPIGALTVVLRATWKMNELPPEDERPKPGLALGAAPAQAIGFGDDVEQRVTEDRDPRTYGRVRSVLTIRYDRPEETPQAASPAPGSKP